MEHSASTTIRNTIQVCEVCDCVIFQSLPYPGNWSIPICKCGKIWAVTFKKEMK